MSWWKRLWFKIRIKLIRLFAGKDLAIMSNVTLSGIVYPRGKYIVVTANFIMGNLDVRTENTEEVHDQVNVDSSA